MNQRIKGKLASLAIYLTVTNELAGVALLFALVFGVLYFDVLAGISYMSFRDMGLIHLPIRSIVSSRFLSGEFPQWYPFDGLGTDYWANANNGLTHPLAWLHLLLPDTVAVGVSVAFSHFAAATGAYALSRHWRCSKIAALAASLAYSLCGYLVCLDGNAPYLVAASAIPWAVYGLATLNVPLCAFSMFWIASSGERIHTLYFTSAFLLGQSLFCIENGRSRRESLKTLALSGVIAVCLSAAHFAPSLKFALDMGGDVNGGDGARWPLNPLRLFQLAVPGFIRLPDGTTPDRLFSQTPTRSFWSDSIFLGTTVLALAWASLANRKNRKFIVPLACLGTVSLMLALGSNGQSPLFSLFARWLPGFGFLRFPEKSFVTVAFSTSMLAAFGLDHVCGDKSAFALRKAKVFTASAIVLVCLFAIVLRRAPLVLAMLSGSDSDLAGIVQELNALSPRLTLQSAIAVLFALMTLVGLSVLRKRPTVGKGILVASIALPAAVTFPASFEYREPVGRLDNAPAVRKAEAAYGDFRYGESRILIPDEFYDQEMPPQCAPAILFPEFGENALVRMETFYGYLCVDRRQALVTSKVNPSVARRAFNVRFEEALEGTDGKCQEDVLTFRRVEGAGDRIRLVRGIPVATADEAKDVANSEGFDPVGTVPVEAAEAEIPGTAPSGESVEVRRYEPELIEIDARSDSDCVLFIADGFSAGWKATVDGVDVPIYPGMIAGRAIPFPKGSHEVRLTYRTPWLLEGMGVALFGFILLAASIVREVRRRRSRPLPTAE